MTGGQFLCGLIGNLRPGRILDLLSCGEQGTDLDALIITMKSSDCKVAIMKCSKLGVIRLCYEERLGPELLDETSAKQGRHRNGAA